MAMRAKRRLYEILETSTEGDFTSRIFDLAIMILIITNAAAIVLETLPELQPYEPYFLAFEILVTVVFTVEYVLRVYACTENSRYAHPLWGRLRYMVSFQAVIDLLAIAPFYIPLFLSPELTMLRLLRLFRFLRLLKLGRYSQSVLLFTNVARRKLPDLLLGLSVLFVAVLFAATIMYHFEQPAQPDKFASILHAMWWAVITLSTVGYGDVAPMTVPGKIVGAFIAILGIGMFAIPAGILSSGFYEEIAKRKPVQTPGTHCPHCGKFIHGDHLEDVREKLCAEEEHDESDLGPPEPYYKG